MLVEGVAGDVNALGYFGLAYYEANTDTLNAVAVDNGDGNCVTPSPETVQDGTYAPLSRPLYVYVKADSLKRPEVQEFVRFYLDRRQALPRSRLRRLTGGGIHQGHGPFEADVSGEGTPDSAATPAASNRPRLQRRSIVAPPGTIVPGRPFQEGHEAWIHRIRTDRRAIYRIRRG